jgi:hypothetical protein
MWSLKNVAKEEEEEAAAAAEGKSRSLNAMPFIVNRIIFFPYQCFTIKLVYINICVYTLYIFFSLSLSLTRTINSARNLLSLIITIKLLLVVELVFPLFRRCRHVLRPNLP